MTTQKNVHDNEPDSKNLVKPGSTMKGSSAPAPQGQPGQPMQQGQTGVMPRQEPSPEDRELMQRRQQEAWDAAAEREKSNNPATKKARTYDKDAPGMHPANQPTENTRINKGTRLDLEDLTGNPGHRGVNPDAPANSINGPPSDRTGKTESINEPPGIPNNERPAGLVAGQGVQGSINEPEGSQVIPPGAGQGVGGAGGGSGTEYETPDIEALEPEEIALGAAATTLSVSGTGFTSQSVISMDGEDVPTTYVSAEEVTTPLDPAQWSAAGVVQVTVKNGGYKSEEVEFEILEANPVGTRQSKRTKPKPPGKGKGKGRGKR